MKRVLSLVMIAALAGCADPAAPVSQGELGVDEDSGAIAGIVTDDALVPLEGVEVVLDGSSLTATDATGAFRFEAVAPGAHQLAAAFSGYESGGAAVEVLAGQVAHVTLHLVPSGVAQGFVETWVQEGLAGCSASYTLIPSEEYSVTNYSLFPCTFLYLAGVHDLDRGNLVWDFGSLEGIAGFFSETEWRTSQALGSQMRVLWAYWLDYETFQAASLQYGAGSSPYRARVPIQLVYDTLENGTVERCIVDKCELMTIHYSGPDALVAGQYGVGVQFQQRFTEYVHVFRGLELPDSYAVLPDQ